MLDKRNIVVHYELSNHLGNVLATISDYKSVVNNGVGLHYEAVVLTATDYDPFGMAMNHRTFNGDGYRFGFNGKENDNEVYGNGNCVAFEARIYDSRIGKFLSIDPKYLEYPNMSHYSFANNSPIMLIDVEGKGADYAIIWDGTQKVVLGVICCVGAGVYIYASSGTGAAFGGVGAMTFGLGEVTIGFGEIADGCSNKVNCEVLQKSGSLPGLMAYSSNNKYASEIDAFGQFIPGILTGSYNPKNIEGNILDLITAMGQKNASKLLYTSLSMYDDVTDLNGFLNGMVDANNKGAFFEISLDEKFGKYVLAPEKIEGQINSQTKNESFNNYTVKSGDNLSNIAKKQGVSLDQLMKDNNIDPKNTTIYPNQNLKINSKSSNLKPNETENKNSGGYRYQMSPDG